ncbi:type-2 angiotensin II receptor [Sceloporus undulatus]|uniref:type-2 angiotensin II receptor n=1 Tax=Sceloporus undulatus TaxID=8520 RepID=UPI001C4D1C3E|nr:type-2 angiotensin II receptor [Sceloporus undulatus]XP_042334049.1 type-2 angiotensin II receptor [Sceloporus undulatus]
MHSGNSSTTVATEETPWDLPSSPTNVSTWPSPCHVLLSNYQFVVIPTLFCAIFILGLVGNSIVVAVLCWRRSPKTVANVYIVNLAVADLLALATVPFWAAYYAYGYNWLFGSVMCKISGSLLSLTMFASIFFITCMSVNRYQAIVHPFKSQRGTPRQASVMVLFVWGLAALASLPTFYFRETKHVQELNVTACIMAYPLERYAKWSAGTALAKNTLGFLIPLSIITVCYISIRVHLTKSRGFRKTKRMRDHVLKLVAAVVVAFLICWLPFHILTFLDALFWMGVVSDCRVTSSIDAALPFGLLMGFANSCINPLLYYFIGRQFQDRLPHLLKLSLFQFNSNREIFCSGKTSSVKTAESLVDAEHGGDAERPQTDPLWVP